MDARDVGTGAALFGFGVLALTAGILYGTPALVPISYALMGSGGALLLNGIGNEIPWGTTTLVALGLGGLISATILMLTRREVPDGFGLASLSLGWIFALLGSELYRQATRPARSRGQTLK